MTFHGLSWRHGHARVSSPKGSPGASCRRPQPQRSAVRPHATRAEAQGRGATGRSCPTSTSTRGKTRTAPSRATSGDRRGRHPSAHTSNQRTSVSSRSVSRHVAPTIAWLLAGQLVVDLVLVALLGFFVYKARALMNTLAKSAAGAEWKAGAMADAFAKAAAGIELTASAAWNSSVASQTIARELRPVAHGSEAPLRATVDLTQLDDPDQDT